MLRQMLLLTLLIAACGPGPSTEVSSDGGTWSIEVQPVETVVGWNEIDLTITPSDGASHATADVTMPAMGHGSSEDVTIEDTGEGTFVVSAYFQMGGAWLLTGTIGTPDEMEAFQADLEVLE